MIKNLDDKTFKYYIYIEYYNVALNLVKNLEFKKTSNITFNKEPRVSKKHLV